MRIGSLTPAFSGTQKRAELLHHPCILGDPRTKGDKIRIGCLSPAFSGAQKSRFWRLGQWGSNLGPAKLESRVLPLKHGAPHQKYDPISTQPHGTHASTTPSDFRVLMYVTPLHSLKLNSDRQGKAEGVPCFAAQSARMCHSECSPHLWTTALY